MAEEEEDDETFGDFTFATFPNQPIPSKSNQGNPADEDDGWGDFVNHSNQINNGSSKPFDPFVVSTDPTVKHVNGNNGIAVQANKHRGAIPLSIFGEEDGGEEEPASTANDFFSKKTNSGGAVKSGSNSNGISDLISNLYNQQPQVNSQNGSVSISNPNATDLDDDDDDGWEFKSAEWETGSKIQNVKVMDTSFFKVENPKLKKA